MFLVKSWTSLRSYWWSVFALFRSVCDLHIELDLFIILIVCAFRECHRRGG